MNSVDWVQCSYQSPYGEIVSNWRRKAGKLETEVTAPTNTAATMYVPARDAAGITESGTAAARAEEVKFLQMENGRAVVAVGSGAYRFESCPLTTQGP